MSAAFQAMMAASSRFYARQTPFFTGDGSATAAQLKDGAGRDVTSDIDLRSIHQTDWQGRVELSSAARTNLATSSGNAADSNAWSNSGVTFSDNGPYTGLPATFENVSVASGGQAWNRRFMTFIANPSIGDVFYMTAFVREGSSGNLLVDATVDGNGSSRIAGAFGSISHIQDTGGAIAELLEQALLSDGSLKVVVKFTLTQAGSTFRCGIGPYTTTAGDDVIVLGGQISKALGIYIPTINSPVTVTDYTHDGTGGITLGQATAAGGALDWSGSGRRA